MLRCDRKINLYILTQLNRSYDCHIAPIIDLQQCFIGVEFSACDANIPLICSLFQNASLFALILWKISLVWGAHLNFPQFEVHSDFFCKLLLILGSWAALFNFS